MKNDRLLTLLLFLLDEGTATAETLSKRLEVSVRTVYRDIESLCAAGIPVMADSGPGGGYAIRKSFRFDKTFFSRGEIHALETFLDGVGKAVKDDALSQALLKIRTLSPESRDGAPGASYRFSLSPWGGVISGQHLSERLRFACEELRLVSFSYTDTKGIETERTVEPREVVITPPSCYLRAYCRFRGEFRVFKVARMKGLSVLSERFDPSVHPSPPDWDALWGTETLETVVLVVDRDALQRALDLFPEAVTEPLFDGAARLVFSYPSGDYLAGLVVSLGGAEVVSPDSLKRQALAVCDRFVAKQSRSAKYTDGGCQG